MILLKILERYRFIWANEKAILALYSAFLSYFTVLLKPSFIDGGDYLDLHQIYRAFFRNALEHGNWPHWNPYTFLGRPFAADIESGIYYPPNWLHLLLPDTMALFINVWLHCFLLCFFALRLLELKGLNGKISLIFVLALPLLAPWRGYYEAGQLHYAYCLSYMPAYFYFVLLLLQGERRRAFLGLSWAMSFSFLGGHPQTFWTLCMGSWSLGGCGELVAGLEN